MIEKLKKMEEDAIIKLGTLVENPVENTEDGVHNALCFVMKHGTAKDKATACMIVGKWMWAHCEIEYHSDANGNNK